MASGIISLGTSGNLMGQLVWSAAANGTAANTSTVTLQLQARKTANTTEPTTGHFGGTITVGGITDTKTQYQSVGPYAWVTVQEASQTVTHNADGTGTCYLYGKITGASGTSLSGRAVSGSDTVTLDTIARYASIVSAPNFDDEENPKITYSNPAGDSVACLMACISLDGTNADIAYRELNKAETAYTFSLTEAERNLLRTAATENSRQVQFQLYTEIGDGHNTDSRQATFTVKDPLPILTPAVADTNPATIALTGDSTIFIKYHSNAAITIGAEAVKGATLVSRKATCGSRVLSGDGTIYGVDANAVSFAVTDSRGNTVTETVPLQLVEYVKLTNSQGNHRPDANGTLKVTASGCCYGGSFGAAENQVTVQYRYKPTGGTYSSWERMTISVSDSRYTAEALLTGLDYRTTYLLQTRATDALMEVTSAERSVKAMTVFDWGADSFAFHVPVAMGGYPISGLPEPREAGAAATKSYVDSMTATLLNRVYPVGSIYLACNALSPEELFGGSWEQIKDRFLLAAGEAYEAGSTGGEAEHTLTVEEMPEHSHNSYGWAGVNDLDVAGNYTVFGANKGSMSSAEPTRPTGGGGAHNNMPPYLAVYVWRRIA